MPENTLLGTGRTAEVFAEGDAFAVKLFRPGFERSAKREREATQAAMAMGVRVPEIHAMVEMDGRVGIRMDRVTGESMLTLLTRNPMAIRRCAHRMAELHAALHAHPAEGADLPPVKDVLAAAVGKTSLPDGEKVRVLRVLEDLPDRRCLCHFDVHPDNIILDAEGGAVLIDWANACVGDPCADVCRTSVMLCSTALPPDLPGHLARPLQDFRASMHRQYLAEYLRLRGEQELNIRRWLAPVAAARLAEQIEGEREYLLRCIEQGLSYI
ncbi:phosphotransferase [Eubacteriales bacterium OttesenSCG-928-A19]|nr:phosphotransferase [Eubacteriales bacterium OttesenSCG-928-A19]